MIIQYRYFDMNKLSVYKEGNILTYMLNHWEMVLEYRGVIGQMCQLCKRRLVQKLALKMMENLQMYVFMYVCKVIWPKAGLSLSLLDKRKEWCSMSSSFLTEPLALWEYLHCTHRHKSAENTTTKYSIPQIAPKLSQPKMGTEPSWELQILL